MVGKTLLKPFETKLFLIMLLMSISAIIFKIYKYATLDIDFLKECNPIENNPGGRVRNLNVVPHRCTTSDVPHTTSDHIPHTGFRKTTSMWYICDTTYMW